MSADPAPVELLKGAAKALSELGVGWYVFGAQAAIVYGVPRMTGDVDITVALASTPVSALVATMQRHGFSLRVANVDDFVRRTRVLPFVHTATTLPLDAVLAGPGPEEQFLARARSISLGGVAVPMISPEDLIVTKVLAARPKDIEDVRGVLAVQVRLDVLYISRTLAMLEEALGQSDLTPLFDDLVRVAKGAKPARRVAKRPRAKK
ncbi:MAG: nucleotidyltransferase [Deltaproteobacteria bacterium]|nr:nucleotidyltransferase [Deltaproteobacteria bacterium]